MSHWKKWEFDVYSKFQLSLSNYFQSDVLMKQMDSVLEFALTVKSSYSKLTHQMGA